MSRIRILPDQVANQIAAGEVVERPASVLKELVENALDAGATRLDLVWEDGGKRLLEVGDDGCGMSRDDLYMALERHATSKVRSADDLGHLGTFGFRGEALPSIASVTRFELHSAEVEGQGHRLRSEFGVIKGVEPAPRRKGTTVTVRDLFLQLPARRRFLKGTDTEHAHLWGVVTRLALATPDVHWTLRTDRGAPLSLPPVSDAGERLGPLLGDKFRDLVAFRNGAPPFQIRGFLSPPSLSFRDRSHLYLFVNGRVVRDRLLLAALAEGWEGYFPKGAYPAVLLFLDLPSEAVDVNVHPTKAEVRFREPSRIFPWVARATREAWEQLKMDAMSVLEMPPKPLEVEDAPLPRRTVASEHPRLWQSTEVLATTFGEAVDRSYDLAAAPSRAAEPDWDEAPAFRYLGAFAHTYLLAEVPSEAGPELWVVDQHVAHERVLYERLFLRRHAPAVQPLLPPRVLGLGPAAVSRLSPWLEELNACGLEIDALGADSVVVRGLPDFLTDRDPERLVADLLHRLETAGKVDLDAFRKELNAELACRAAVKANERLPDGMALNLLRDLLACEVPHTCPHGRPIMKRLTLAEVERSFGRRT